MPEIKAKIVVQLPEPEAGEKYVIQQAKLKDTKNSDQEEFSGVEVKLASIKGGKEPIAQTMLWYKEEAGENSKLGCFLKALGNNTDTWVGKKIEFLEWKNKKRSIGVIP